MKINLQFDYHSRIIYIPDGYVNDIRETQQCFFEWLYEQSEYIIKRENRISFEYNEDVFLKFVNEEILVNSKERAYFIKTESKTPKKIPILRF